MKRSIQSWLFGMFFVLLLSVAPQSAEAKKKPELKGLKVLTPAMVLAKKPGGGFYEDFVPGPKNPFRQDPSTAKPGGAWKLGPLK